MRRIAAGAVSIGLILLTGYSRGGAEAPPAQLDTDGDGVPDFYESNGIDLVYPDGFTQHLDLSSSPSHKDVFVFYAWMAAPGGHNHKPMASNVKLPDGTPVDSQSLGRVYDAFAKAPIHNVDNVDGVKLHLFPVHLPEIPETASNRLLGGLTGGPNSPYDWTAFNAIKQQLFPKIPAAAASAFHFCLFAHQLGGDGLDSTSGVSNGIPSRDLIVSLGSGENQTGTADDQVGTFMHELGHNLGLHHGGGDDLNYKPNYPSVMNYLFQFIGTIRSGSPGVFDYSRIAVDLDEGHLNDATGITSNPAAASFGSAHLCSDGSQYIIPSFNDPVRWEDCDESPTPNRVFSFDVNGDAVISRLSGQEDWPDTFPVVGAVSQLMPKDEAPSLAGVAQTLSLMPAIEAARRGAQVQLKWTQLPLQRVQGYQVMRRTNNGPMQPLVITKKNTYQDSGTQLNATFAYVVRPIVGIPSRPSVAPAAAGVSTLPSRVLFGGVSSRRVAYGKFSNEAVVAPASN